MRLLVTSFISFVLIFGNPVFAQDYSFLFTFKLFVKTNTLKLSQLAIAVGEAPIQRFQPEDGHTLKLLSSDKEELYSFKFAIPRPPAGSPPKKEWFNEKGEQIYIPTKGEPTDLPEFREVSFTVMTPFIDGARMLEVYDPQNKKILTASIPSEDELIEKLVDQEKNFQLSEKQQQKKEDTADKQEKNGTDAIVSSNPLLPIILVVSGLISIVLIGVSVLFLRKKK